MSDAEKIEDGDIPISDEAEVTLKMVKLFFKELVKKSDTLSMDELTYEFEIEHNGEVHTVSNRKMMDSESMIDLLKDVGMIE